MRSDTEKKIDDIHYEISTVLNAIEDVLVAECVQALREWKLSKPQLITNEDRKMNRAICSLYDYRNARSETFDE